MRSTRHTSRRLLLAGPVAAAAAVMLTAGCGGSSAYSGSSGDKSSGGETSSGGGGKKITVDESEFALKASSMTLKAGSYTFVAKNKGQVTHALEVEGPGVEKETKEISGGESASLTATLKKGSYELYCPVDGHKDQGMKLTLTVT